MPISHVLYLHGFASSPGSTKANFFCERFTREGMTCHIPDLNVPSFETLTLTAMIGAVAAAIRNLPAAGDVGLIGSSMGGLTALHFMNRYRESEAKRVKQVVLMAPALEFMANRNTQMGEDGLAAWQSAGHIDFFHYAHNKAFPVHYGLVEDVQGYDSYAVTLDAPITIFHGKQDASVDYGQSVRYADANDNVTLHLLDSDHQLLDQTEFMWTEMLRIFK